MTSVRTLKVKYTSGELDPRLISRNDTRHLEEGAETLRNVLLLTQGGFVRRPGYEELVDLNFDGYARVKRFRFNKNQQYLLCFRDKRLQIFRVDTDTASETYDQLLQVAELLEADGATWSDSEISTLWFTQYADTMIIFHSDLQPVKLKRGGSHSAWTLSAWGATNIPNFPFAGTTITTPGSSATLTPSATSGTVTLTASAGTPFSAATVGQYINGNGGRARVIQYNSSTVVRAIMETTFYDTSAIANGSWNIESGYEPVWSADRGWPTSGTLLRNRLFLGGSRDLPNGVWGSRIGLPFDFDIGRGLDNEAIAIITDGEPDPIVGTFAGPHLILLSQAREIFVPYANGNTPTFTPGSFSTITYEENGARPIKPVSVEGAVYYVGDGGKVIYAAIYNDVKQGYEAQSVSTLSPHLIRNPQDMAFLRPSDDQTANYILIVNGDGTVATLNTLRQEEINGWTLQETLGSVLSVEEMDNRAYFTVNRTIAGQPKTFIERWNWNNWLDCSKYKAGASDVYWEGFQHLNGQLCSVRADDFIVADSDPATAAGSVVLEKEAEAVEVGLPFYAIGKTMPFDVKLGLYDTFGKPRKVVRVDIEAYKTREFVVKCKNDTVIYRPPLKKFDGAVFDAPAEPFSGKIPVWLGVVDTTAQVTITQEKPLPLGILGVALEVNF